MVFKAKDYEDEGGNFEVVPSGEYTLALIKVERKESSTSGNYYQNCQMKIIGGKYKGRIIFHMFNLTNSTEKAVEIARGQLSSMMKSIGISTLDDEWNFEPLMSKPFKAKIKTVIDPTGTYDPKNAIARFLTEETTTKEKKSNGPGNEPWGDSEPKKKKKDKKKKGKKKMKDDIPF